MKTRKTAVNISLLFLLGISVLLYACGSGSGGSSSGTPGAGVLYITDAPVDTYQQVILTIYGVDFEKQDGTRVSIFNDAMGLTYDVSTLNGILAKLPGASIPAGVYSKVLITVGSEAVLVDAMGNPVTAAPADPVPPADPADPAAPADPAPPANPLIATNAWTTCQGDKCTIEIANSVTVINNQSIILDFDLKNFDYNDITNTLTAKVTLQNDCSAFKTYFVEKEDDYELKGIIKTIGTNSFDIMVTKAEHFKPQSNTITVNIDHNSTGFTCDDDVSKAMCRIFTFFDLQAGMTVEIHGQWDGQQMAAALVEVDNDNDLVSGALSCSSVCADTGRSVNEYSSLIQKPETENTLYTFDPDNYSITVNGKEILISQETVVKVEDENGEQETESVICAEDIPFSAGQIEVEYSSGFDADDNPVYLAREIEFEL